MPDSNARPRRAGRARRHYADRRIPYVITEKGRRWLEEHRQDGPPPACRLLSPAELTAVQRRLEALSAAGEGQRP